MFLGRQQGAGGAGKESPSGSWHRLDGDRVAATHGPSHDGRPEFRTPARRRPGRGTSSPRRTDHPADPAAGGQRWACWDACVCPSRADRSARPCSATWPAARPLGGHRRTPPRPDRPPDDALTDDDLQICLAVLYELHYRGFDERRRRAGSGTRPCSRLRAGARGAGTWRPCASAGRPGRRSTDEPVDRQLAAMIAADDGPSLSSFMAKQGTLEQWREYLTLRSVYHLKEADPHTFAIPRLAGRAKAAHGRDPGRRVRRRLRRADAQRAVRRPDARPRPGRHATARSGTTPPPRRSPRSTRCRCSVCTGAGAVPRSVTWPRSR